MSHAYDFARRRRLLLTALATVAYFLGGCVGHALAHGGPCLVAPAPHLDSATVYGSPYGVQQRAAFGLPVETGGLSSPLWSDGLDTPSDFDLPGHLSQKALSTKLSGHWSAFLRAVGISQPNFKMLALMPVFPDKGYITPPQFFDSLLFGPVWGTATHYWEDQSGGTLRIGTDNLPSAIGLVPMDSSYAYYVNNNYGFSNYPRNTQRLVEDLVKKADSLFPQIDYTTYDNNHDGRVDGLTVIHPGTGAEWSGSTSDIWSHKWGVREQFTRDGVYFGDFSIQPEYWSPTYKMTVGVYAHEWGHVLSLPDQYDLDNSSYGLGKLCGMAGGSWNAKSKLGDCPAGLCSWCRLRLGFTGFQVLQAGYMTFVEHQVWRYSVGAGGLTSKYYYLAELRWKNGYDAALPAAGVFLWRVDDNQRSNSKEWHPAKTTSGNYWVALIQATADVPAGSGFMLERHVSQGAAHMTYPASPSGTRPAVDSIGPETVPSTNWYDGTPTGLSFDRFRIEGQTVTASVSFGCYCGLAGDVNLDGKIDWSDVLPDPTDPSKPSVFGCIYFGAMLTQLPDCPRLVGDVNCDGELTVLDGAYLVDLIQNQTALPCMDQCK